MQNLCEYKNNQDGQAEQNPDEQGDQGDIPRRRRIRRQWDAYRHRLGYKSGNMSPLPS